MVVRKCPKRKLKVSWWFWLSCIRTIIVFPCGFPQAAISTQILSQKLLYSVWQRSHKKQLFKISDSHNIRYLLYQKHKNNLSHGTHSLAIADRHHHSSLEKRNTCGRMIRVLSICQRLRRHFPISQSERPAVRPSLSVTSQPTNVIV